MKNIIIKGLNQNNLKDLSFSIPKGKLVVFTGVSGSGKSSIVFDTIAAESQRQIKETYSTFVRSRMPKYNKPTVDYISNLSPSIIVDQSPLGGNIRSTVGTISDIYSNLRLLFSRIGTPHIGPASYFSFNNTNGMCPNCSGIGKIATINIDYIIDKNKSLNEGALIDSTFKVGSWFWKKYTESGFFDNNKTIKDFSTDEYNKLLYGSGKLEGIYNQYERMYLNRDISEMSNNHKIKASKLISQKKCPICNGQRLSESTLSCKIKGYNIFEMCEMELSELYPLLNSIEDITIKVLAENITTSLKRLMDIGLPYLHLNRESSSLSGGEAQRLKLVRYMGSSLVDMIYIFDEPSTGLHPRDVYRMNKLLLELRDKGNTVIVVEHDKDVIKIADEIIDIGPLAGKHGGEIVFQGSYENLVNSNTLTGKSLNENIPINSSPRNFSKSLVIENANIHNLKNITVEIPLNIMTGITGVAGSGKSSLISKVFAEKYKDNVVKIDQSPITATSRSMPATFLGFFDNIRKLFSTANNVDPGLFSFNSKGACPNCKGKGIIVTELAFMDPIITECESCNGNRYSNSALSYKYKGKNIIEVLNLTAEESLEFFEDKKILKYLQCMVDVGLSYMKLGQQLSTLSGGEAQRVKLAKYIGQKGNIYILDEPTTGLHPSDIKKLLILFNTLVNKGNTLILIEHNLDVIKQCDYIIDIGPDGGKKGGEIVFSGRPLEMVYNSNTITAKALQNSIL